MTNIFLSAYVNYIRQVKQNISNANSHMADALYKAYNKCINKYKCKLYKSVKFLFNMYTSKPLYVNYIYHKNQFKIN